ncbi:hypothetical protein ACFO6V_04455 [Promicromonospora alba]|uniref:PH (Pleckstrin Homology) domain-containing protein n=1 Tax=Promicromonospora alba TaxID=1616110 RepID=A0ABV9HBY2_9MICO
MATYDEVWADDTILLCNDGHVLEIFGFTDAHRYHLGMHRPRIEIEERKRSTKVVVKTTGGGHTFDVGPAQLDAVRAFATRLDEAVALAITRTPPRP